MFRPTYTPKIISMEVEDEFVQETSVTLQFSNSHNGVFVPVIDCIQEGTEGLSSCNSCETMKIANHELSEDKKKCLEMVDFWKSLALVTCETATELHEMNDKLRAENKDLMDFKKRSQASSASLLECVREQRQKLNTILDIMKR